MNRYKNQTDKKTFKKSRPDFYKRTTMYFFIALGCRLVSLPGNPYAMATAWALKGGKPSLNCYRDAGSRRPATSGGLPDTNTSNDGKPGKSQARKLGHLRSQETLATATTSTTTTTTTTDQVGTSRMSDQYALF